MVVILASVITTEVIIEVGDLRGQRSFIHLTIFTCPFATNSALAARITVAAIVIIVTIVKASFVEDNCLFSCLSIHMDEFLNFRVQCYHCCLYCISDSTESSSDAYDVHCCHLHY